MTSDVLTAAAQQGVRIRVFWWGGRRGWRKYWWRLKEASCLCRSDHWSQVWVTAADFSPLPRSGVDLRIFATSLSHPAMHRGDLRWPGLVWQGKEFYEYTYLSLEGQHICRSVDPRLRLLVSDLAHFHLGNLDARCLMTILVCIGTCWARISPPSLIIWWLGGENMQIFTHLA